MGLKGTIRVGVAIAAAAVAAWYLGRNRERKKTDRLAIKLLDTLPPKPPGKVRFSNFTDLPSPVARYLKLVLKDGQRFIRSAGIRQAGVLRTSTQSDRWLAFTARQIVVPGAPGFVWNARVQTPLGAHLRVVDSYMAGRGAGAVSLLSAFPLSSESGSMELDSGSLLRYLAEAVWYPTALLPESGVVWTPIDDATALATLSDRDTTVSLEFRFDKSGEVTGIYSPGRFGRFEGRFKKIPWEGHFRNYREHGGLRVPGYAEVGWHGLWGWQPVWKGNLVGIQFALTDATDA